MTTPTLTDVRGRKSENPTMTTLTLTDVRGRKSENPTTLTLTLTGNIRGNIQGIWRERGLKTKCVYNIWIAPKQNTLDV